EATLLPAQAERQNRDHFRERKRQAKLGGGEFMTMRVRAALLLPVALAMMGLASCGHYVCGVNFGNSTCTAGQVGLTGGGGGSAAAAFTFVLNGTAAGSI